MYGIERPEPMRAEPRPKSSRNPGVSGLAVQIGNAPARRGAGRIAGFRVGGKLRTSAGTPPCLCKLDERAADAMAARFGRDIPPLEIGDAIRAATLGTGADRELRKPDRGSGAGGRDQHRQRLTRTSIEEAGDLIGVLHPRAGGPERAPQLKPQRGIGPFDGSDHEPGQNGILQRYTTSSDRMALIAPAERQLTEGTAMPKVRVNNITMNYDQHFTCIRRIAGDIRPQPASAICAGVPPAGECRSRS